MITATQMLDSMVASSRPTRAEVTDVANAILDGTDAVMLSQESAVGQFPVESIAMLATIAKRTEQTLPYRDWNERRVRRDRRDPAYTLAYAATRTAHELGLAALVCPTLSGRSARLISAHRPTVPIYALSPGRETVRRCGLMWGVQAASMRRYEVTEELIAAAARRVVELGWCKPGDRVGITAGLPSGKPGTTSLLQVQRSDALPARATCSGSRPERSRWRSGAGSARGSSRARRQRTPIGVIAFDAVEVVEEISAEEARAAGFETPEQVEAAMPPRGPIHRVALRLEGPDPRVALRETPPDDALFARLDRMGPWTYEYLQLIAEQPAVRAGDLAESVGRERLDFKRDVRKLKELGLTESLNPGYRLSPRGEAVR